MLCQHSASLLFYACLLCCKCRWLPYMLLPHAGCICRHTHSSIHKLVTQSKAHNRSRALRLTWTPANRTERRNTSRRNTSRKEKLFFSQYTQNPLFIPPHYLLKKDSYFFVPNHETHFDTHANDLDVQRFIKLDSKPLSGAFRRFGGGVNHCPGKLFAMTKIMALVAMFALRYHIIPVFRQWLDRQQDTRNMSLAIGPPKKKVSLNFVPGTDGKAVSGF